MRKCRVCGCTDTERCAMTVRQIKQGRPAGVPARRYAQTYAAGHCSLHRAPGGWLCTRCVTPERRTTRQQGEISRILERQPLEVREAATVVRGQYRGELVLYAGRTICVPLPA